VRATAGEWLNGRMAGEALTIVDLRNSLWYDVCGAVSNHAGEEYDQYPADGNDMKFGTISVDVKDFINCFLELTGTLDEFPS
jgi:hypothetical protein